MNRLEELRKKNKLSQQQVADFLKITQQAYSHYEKGRREADYKTLLKLADYFDTTIDYLLGKSDDLIPSNRKELSLSKKAQTMYDGLKSIGLDPDTMTDEDFKSMFLFIDRNRDLILSYSNAIARGERIGK